MGDIPFPSALGTTATSARVLGTMIIGVVLSGPRSSVSRDWAGDVTFMRRGSVIAQALDLGVLVTGILREDVGLPPARANLRGRSARFLSIALQCGEIY